ncbi:MAG: hypothetical protein AAF690_09180 [Acidobacteriota bacterium]
MRLFFWLLGPLTLIALTLGLAISTVEKLGGGCAGIVCGVGGAAAVGLGLLLAYWVGVDAFNLLLLRRFLTRGATPRDGRLLALEGRAEIEGEARPAPFSGTRCAGYLYRVAAQRYDSTRESSSTVDLLYGAFLAPTHIVGPNLGLELASLPAFGDELRTTVTDGRWTKGAVRLVDRLRGRAALPSAKQRQERLLELQSTRVRSIDEEHCADFDPAEEASLTIEEQILPVGEDLCWIGTYHASERALTGTRPRLGPNLQVYRGDGRTVMERLAGEVRGFGLTALALVGLGALLISVPYWPSVVLEALPFLEAAS